MDDCGGDVIIPIATFTNKIPLRLRAVKCDGGKRGAIIESIIAYGCYRIRNGDGYEGGAAVES